MPEKVVMSWSSGKDSASALYEIQQKQEYEVVSLLTTLTEDYDRVSMHGVRQSLLEQQAESLCIPLQQISLPKEASIEEYESEMQAALARFQEAGVSSVVFGDIFLEDIRQYREDKMSKAGMKAVFPLWGRSTAELAQTSVDLGFKAIVTCIDTKVLSKSFAGRVIDASFLRELPANIDPCGENGEFHSFVFDGPIFRKRLPLTVGQEILRESFYFCDLIPE